MNGKVVVPVSKAAFERHIRQSTWDKLYAWQAQQKQAEQQARRNKERAMQYAN